MHRLARRECCRQAVARGDYASALSIATEWINREPGDDEAHHAYIDLLATHGQYREALAHYNDYAATLARDDLQPLDETTKLSEEIRRRIAAAEREQEPSLRKSRPWLATTMAPDTRAASPARSRIRQLLPATLVLALVGGAAMYATRAANSEPSSCTIDITASCAALDSANYVVLPFSYTQDGQPASDGFVFADAVSAALARVEGVNVIDRMRVIDAVQRMSADPTRRLEVDSAIMLSRRLGARNAMIGEVQRLGDSVRVTASLYDVALAPAGSRSVEVRLSATDAFASAPGQVVDSLLALRLASTPLSRSISLVAARELGLGEAALAAWELSDAREHYEKATEADATDARAFYRLAQVMMWQLDTTLVWRAAAERTFRLRAQLPAVDSALATAIYFTAIRDYASACSAFRNVLRSDSLNFVAWYGLGDCLTFDQIVLPDPAAPSGRRFRSSYTEAINAYSRALQLAPSFSKTFRGMALARLSKMFFVNPTMHRYGVELGTGAAIAAIPVMQGDTIALMPFPVDSIGSPGVEAKTKGQDAALFASRRQLRSLLTEWTRATPSAESYTALAELNEVAGAIRSVGDPERSALDAADAAIRFTTTSTARLGARATRLRLLLKQGRFADARELADSIVDEHPAPKDQELFMVASAAVLQGKIHHAAALLANSTVPAARYQGLHVSDVRASRRLLIYAAVGAPRDSIRAIAVRLENSIDPLPVSDRSRNSAILLMRQAAFAHHAVGPLRVHRNTQDWPLIKAQHAASLGNAAKARALLNENGEHLPDDLVEADLAFAHIALELQIGDTASATREMDTVLGDLGQPRYAARAQPNAGRWVDQSDGHASACCASIRQDR
jgi:eukaryotic-like serine/threonine-protein kinase